MDKHKVNKLHRQSARTQLQDTIFFADFIHKLNNKLCVVQGNAQLALAKYCKPEEALTLIEQIVNDTNISIGNVTKKLQHKQLHSRSQNVAV